MTLRDVQNEILNYEYSQEYFNMMKECAELDLKAIYLDSQRYIKENAGNIDLPDGYLMESVDDTTLDAMYEEVEQKKKGLLHNIGAGLMKAINALLRFLGIADKKLSDIFLEIDELNKVLVELNHVTESNEKVSAQVTEQLTKIMNARIKGRKFSGIKVNKIEGDAGTCGFFTRMKADSPETYANYAVAMNKTGFSLDIGEEYRNKICTLMNIDKATDIITKMLSESNITESTMNTLLKLLTPAESGVVKFDNMYTNMHNMQGKLKACLDAIANLDKSSQDIRDNTPNVNSRVDVKGKHGRVVSVDRFNMAKFNEVIVKYQTAATSMTVLINDLISFRSAVIKDLSNMANHVMSKAGKESDTLKKANDKAKKKDKNKSEDTDDTPDAVPVGA